MKKQAFIYPIVYEQTMKQNPYDPESYPMYITIATQSDLTQKSRVKVYSLEDIKTYQKARYEVSYD